MPAVRLWSAVGYDIRTADPSKLGLISRVDQRQPVAYARRSDPEVVGTDQSARSRSYASRSMVIVFVALSKRFGVSPAVFR